MLEVVINYKKGTPKWEVVEITKDENGKWQTAVLASFDTAELAHTRKKDLESLKKAS